MTTFFVALIFVIGSLTCLSLSLPAISWEIGSLVYIFITTGLFGSSLWLALLLLLATAAIAAVTHLQSIQDYLVDQIYQSLQRGIIKLSDTEKEALKIGDTWIEASLFKGEVDWEKLYGIPATSLTEEEQHFIENETMELCNMFKDWDVFEQKDLPSHVWQFMKDKKFFGLVIEKEHGGLGFSAKAHSAIVLKLASHSSAAAVTVMVPNSLGPGELITRYGTPLQQETYLPALAKGEEVPCFALTEPTAGSDATSIHAEAVVQARTIKGKKTIGLRLNFEKRWITLAPVATLIGLAVKLIDPDKLLSEGKPGITCLLLPRSLPGLEIGNRHIPCSQYFMNGTVRGKDLWVGLDAIIGGEKNAGQGWRMLVECLSIGRSISLPTLGASTCHLAYLTSSAYAKVRRQFNTSIGSFEGVQEKMAEIAGLSFITDATRELTVAAVDAGKKPSVASAIAKYFNTEHGRRAVNHAMDIHGGKAIVNGPRNPLLSSYQSMPICITVEGANIMTRNLLIFGQGAMACHPFVREEYEALANEDKQRFGQLLWQHLAYFSRNFANTCLAALANGRLLRSPKRSHQYAHRQIARLSFALAWVNDLSLMVLGGAIRRKERLSARLGDALAHLYMACAVLKVQADRNDPANDQHAQWALSYCLNECQNALDAFTKNFPSRLLGTAMRWVIFPWGKRLSKASDKVDSKLAELMQVNQSYRHRLKELMYLGGGDKNPIQLVEQAFQQVIETEPSYRKISGIGKVAFQELEGFLSQKVDEQIITAEEKDALLKAETARWQAIQVDEFSFESFQAKSQQPTTQQAATETI